MVIGLNRELPLRAKCQDAQKVVRIITPGLKS